MPSFWEIVDNLLRNREVMDVIFYGLLIIIVILLLAIIFTWPKDKHKLF
jgi:hypothetical protein